MSEPTNDVTAGIPVVRPSWAALAKNCVQVVLDIKHPSGSVTLKPEHIGLEDAPDDWKALKGRYLRLGSYYVIPEEIRRELHTRAMRARQLTLAAGVKAPWGGSSFLVYRAHYLEWVARMEELKTEFDEWGQRLVDERPEWALQIRQSLIPMATTAVAVRCGNIPSVDFVPEESDSVQELLDLLCAKIPGPDKLETRLQWTVAKIHLDTPAQRDEEYRRLEQEKLDLLREIETVELRVNDLNNAERAALEDRRLQLRIVEDATRTHAEAVQRELGALLTEVASRSREIVLNVVSLIDKQTSSGREVTGRYWTALRKAAEELSTVNLADDPDVEAMRERIEALIGKGDQKDVSAAEIREAMDDLRAVSIGGLLALDREDRIPDTMEIPADLEELIPAARARLAGVELVEVAPDLEMTAPRPVFAGALL